MNIITALIIAALLTLLYLVSPALAFGLFVFFTLDGILLIVDRVGKK
jgi:hypothetical protein